MPGIYVFHAIARTFLLGICPNLFYPTHFTFYITTLRATFQKVPNIFDENLELLTYYFTDESKWHISQQCKIQL